MSKQTILDLKKSLTIASSSTGNAQATLSLLKRLEAVVVPTEQLLRETKIGVTVGALRQHSDSKVKALAKAIVKKWRAAVGPVGTKKEQESKRASTSPEASTSHSLPTPVSEKPSIRVTTTKTTKSPSPAPSRSASPPNSSTSPTASRTPASALARDKPLRTFKTDGVVFDRGQKKEKSKIKNTRASVCELLYDSLAFDSDVSPDTLRHHVLKIENAAWKLYPPVDGDEASSQTYRNKMRQLSLSLKKAAREVRAQVIGGEIKADKLLSMSWMDLASDELKTTQSKLAAKSLQSVVHLTPTGADDDKEKMYKGEQAWHAKGR